LAPGLLVLPFVPMLWFLLAVATVAEDVAVVEHSEVSGLEDRHDRVKLCHRVVKDLAVRDSSQMKDDIQVAIQDSVNAFEEINNTIAELPEGAEQPELPEILNGTTAVGLWTKRAMAACILNAQESDIEDFKKPGGAFINWARVQQLATRNESKAEFLSVKGYADLDRVLMGADSVQKVGDGWGVVTTFVYFCVIMSVLVLGAMKIIQGVTGKVERKKTEKELKNEAKKFAKKGMKDE